MGAADLPDTVLVVGSLDAKYVKESSRMLQRMSQQGQQEGGAGSSSQAGSDDRESAADVGTGEAASGADILGGRHRRVEVAGCGHAVHIEAPLALLEVLLSLPMLA